MRERVSVIQGNIPMLLVAPHGSDDNNTDLLTEEITKHLGCYAIINRGFDCANYVDVENDKADCNRIDHITKDVVFDEFLKPILKINQKLTGMTMFSSLEQRRMSIFYIHGVEDSIHKIANERVDVVLGYGIGRKKDSLTCKRWKKNLLVELWRSESHHGEVYEGKGGGKYAGRSANNLNQYFRKHKMDRNVDSMELQVPNCYRTDSEIKNTATRIATVLERLSKWDSSNHIVEVKSDNFSNDSKFI